MAERRPGCAWTRSRIGDYVLAGGEVAVLVMVEAVGRLLPGVLGNADSAVEDSFAPGAMEACSRAPSTPSRRVARAEVPEILLSGDHGAIARGGGTRRCAVPRAHRPELLAALDPASLDKHDRRALAEPDPRRVRRSAGRRRPVDFRRSGTLWQTEAVAADCRSGPQTGLIAAGQLRAVVHFSTRVQSRRRSVAAGRTSVCARR